MKVADFLNESNQPNQEQLQKTLQYLSKYPDFNQVYNKVEQDETKTAPFAKKLLNKAGSATKADVLKNVATAVASMNPGASSSPIEVPADLKKLVNDLSNLITTELNQKPKLTEDVTQTVIQFAGNWLILYGILTYINHLKQQGKPKATRTKDNLNTIKKNATVKPQIVPEPNPVAAPIQKTSEPIVTPKDELDAIKKNAGVQTPAQQPAKPQKPAYPEGVPFEIQPGITLDNISLAQANKLKAAFVARGAASSYIDMANKIIQYVQQRDNSLLESSYKPRPLSKDLNQIIKSTGSRVIGAALAAVLLTSVGFDPVSAITGTTPTEPAQQVQSAPQQAQQNFKTDLSLGINGQPASEEEMLKRVDNYSDTVKAVGDFLYMASSAGKIPNTKDENIYRATLLNPGVLHLGIYQNVDKGFNKAAAMDLDPEQVKDVDDHVSALKDQWNNTISKQSPEQQQQWFHTLATDSLEQYAVLKTLNDKLLKARNAKSAGLN